MRLGHPEYIKLVFRTYQWLRSTSELSPALKQPTPASIRKECLHVYEERPPDRKDEAALRSFFGPADDNNSFLKPIKKFPTENFRAFCNYLKGKAVNTDHKNVELLAWLIDFPHRPLRLDVDVILNESEKALLNSDESASEHLSEEIEDEEDDDNSEDSFDQSPETKKELTTPITSEEPVSGYSIKQVSETKPALKKKWIIVGSVLLFALILLGAYFIYYKSDNCMYWAGDHYERIDCDEEVNDKVVFNEERWKKFRKITDLSTITEKSIGVVHYYGNKKREFFTCGGKHPVETTRYLKVMTRYIWEKEFGSKDSVAKDSSVDENRKPVLN